MIINDITVLDRIKDELWNARCHCGKIFTVKASNTSELIFRPPQRFPRSCGCKKNQYVSEKSWKGYQEISGGYWSRLQHCAKKRNLIFDITIEQIWDIFLKQDRKCGLTGLDIKFWTRMTPQTTQTASLDRIDNNKGYIIENVWWLHKKVNRLKTNMTNDELIYWSTLIHNHAKKSNHTMGDTCSYNV